MILAPPLLPPPFRAHLIFRTPPDPRTTEPASGLLAMKAANAFLSSSAKTPPTLLEYTGVSITVYIREWYGNAALRSTTTAALFRSRPREHFAKAVKPSFQVLDDLFGAALEALRESCRRKSRFSMICSAQRLVRLPVVEENHVAALTYFGRKTRRSCRRSIVPRLEQRYFQFTGQAQYRVRVRSVFSRSFLRMVSPAPPSNNTLSTGLFGVGAKFSGTCGSGLARHSPRGRQ